MAKTVQKIKYTPSPDKQGLKQGISKIAPFRFKPGISGNPKGRPKGKTLKEYCKEYLSCMTEKERCEFLNSLTPEFVWRMAEGNPKEDNTPKFPPFNFRDEDLI